MTDGRKGIVVSLCDYTGNAVRPWLEDGYECWLVDIRHPEGETREGGLRRFGMDVREFALPDQVRFLFAFPPCTHLAVSGARWFRGKGLGALADSIRIVAACADLAERSRAPYVIENPVSTLSTYWRKPDYTFDPAAFAGYLEDPSREAYTKKTCLWTGRGFVMPKPRPVEPVLGSRIHLMPPSPDRAEKRSETPKGFAQAVCEANR